MNCPACDHPLQEIDPACPQCGFSLDQADATFGQPPFISHPVTDPDRHLGNAATRRLGATILAFRKRFPQVPLTLLVLEKPQAVAAKPYLFWLFNRSTTHTAMEKGGNNRQILLWIDPTARSASAIVGYGLEPLIVPETHLNPCLQAGAQALAAGQLSSAVSAIIAHLSTQFESLAEQLPKAFGWVPDHLWQAMDDDDALLTLEPERLQTLNY